MSMFMKKKKTCVNCMMKLKPLVLNVSPGPSQQKAWESRCLWQPARGRPSGEQGHLWPEGTASNGQGGHEGRGRRVSQRADHTPARKWGMF